MQRLDSVWQAGGEFSGTTVGNCGYVCMHPHTRTRTRGVDELNHQYDSLTWQLGQNSRQQWFHWPGVTGFVLFHVPSSSIHSSICVLWYLNADSWQAVNRTCSFFNCSQMKQQIEVQLITSISAVQQLLYKLQTRLDVYSLLRKCEWCKSCSQMLKCFFTVARFLWVVARVLSIWGGCKGVLGGR